MRKTGSSECEEVIGKVQVHLVANICGHSGLSLHVGVVLCANSVKGVWPLWSLFTRRCGIVCKVWCRQLGENGSMVNYCERCEQTLRSELVGIRQEFYLM